mgnify:CR=1 FL=1
MQITKEDGNPIIFRSIGIYSDLVTNPKQTVQIDDSIENKGSARILKNIINVIKRVKISYMTYLV